MGLQLLRELQQHKLFPLVEASLEQELQREPATDGSANGSPDETALHQGSSGEHDAERVTVFLLLTPTTSWESVHSLVSWLLNCPMKLQRCAQGP